MVDFGLQCVQDTSLNVAYDARHQQKSGYDDYRGDNAYPTSTTVSLTSWVAWMVRAESFAALGMSRFYSTLISIPVAVCLLQPFIQDCGQAPLMGLRFM
ncbi:hypothetical protein TSMEX_003196 [Taenia solium]|eukprot:TsM_001124800 transcript=TsM_001124800 gene=TsM_001124800